MLRHILSIYEYRDYLDSEKENLGVNDLKRLSGISFKKAIFKLRKLDVGLASSLLNSLYSSTGRPAIDPSILLRSFILMQHFGCFSLHKWYEAISSDALLQYLIGTNKVPSISSHYDFIVRLTGIKQKLNELYPKKLSTPISNGGLIISASPFFSISALSGSRTTKYNTSSLL